MSEDVRTLAANALPPGLPPGPWRADRRRYGAGSDYHIFAADGALVAIVCDYGQGSSPARAMEIVSAILRMAPSKETNHGR